MSEYKIIIPSEILHGSRVDFSKPVYIYESGQHLLCISNSKKTKLCFGKISIDNEFTFELTQNTLQSVLDSYDYIMCVSHGKIYIKPYTGYISPTKNIPFTIPKEIVEVNNIDFNKPVYLCFSESEGKRYYLSNHLDRNFSLGRITFSDNYSFNISPNISKALNISSADELSVYVSDNRIYFKCLNRQNSYSRRY